MAQENVKKFYDEISTNKELQEKFLAAQKSYEVEGKSEEEIFQDIVLPIATEAGCEFTMSEYKKAQRETMAEKGISEEELENVSGGIKGGCSFLGMGTSAVACFIVGEDTGGDAEDAWEGGIVLCVFVGVGFGSWC